MGEQPSITRRPVRRVLTTAHKYIKQYQTALVIVGIILFFYWMDSGKQPLRDQIDEVNGHLTTLRENIDKISRDELKAELDDLILLTDPPPPEDDDPY
jgi:hypothetical protein